MRCSHLNRALNIQEIKLSYSSVIMWICVVIFAVTAVIAILDLSGLRKIEDKGKSKALFTTLIIAIAGASVTAFKDGLSNKEETLSHPEVIEIPSENNQPTKTHSRTSSDTSLKIGNNDLLAVKGEQGIAVVAIKALEGCKATYTWRFLPDGSSQEQKGVGSLYEKYAVEKEEESKKHLMDLNGKLSLDVGPYNLLWSCASDSASWVYRQEKVKLGRLSNTELATYKF